MRRSNSYLGQLMHIVSVALIPSYHGACSVMVGSGFSLDRLSLTVKSHGGAIISTDKNSLVFRVQCKALQIGSILVVVGACGENSCEVTLTFDSFKRVTIILFSLVVLGGVIFVIPTNYMEAAINLILIIFVWKLVVLGFFYRDGIPPKF